jgi:hypothetical protein
VHREAEFLGALDEGLVAADNGAVIGVGGDHGDGLVTALLEVIGGHAAVLGVVRLDVIAGVGRAERRVMNHTLGSSRSLARHSVRGLHALHDDAVELLVGEVAGEFARVAGEKDAEVDAVARVGRLDLEQLVLKPVKARVVGLGPNEPHADAALLGQAGLGPAATVERGRHIAVLLHDRPDTRQAVRSDQLRLIDGPGNSRGGNASLLGNFGEQHGVTPVLKVSVTVNETDRDTVKRFSGIPGN